ncbi:MAG: hypothetical protein JW829_10060 [Pirellulales bacterium]|nr:hypothetical protein [Pirellulales bacterium]
MFCYWFQVPLHLAVLVVLLAAVPTNYAQDPPKPAIAREHHPWTRFHPGAWRATQLTTETLDPDGRITCRATTLGYTTLQAIKEDRYSLHEETMVDSRGRQVNGPPQVTWHNIYVDDTSDAQTEELSEPKIIDLNGRSVTCRVFQVRLTGRSQPKVAQILYDQEDFPYILQRESHIVQDDPKSEPAWQSVTEVIAVDMPYPFQNEVFQTSHLRTVITTNKVRIVRMAIVCETVPGGLVAEWSKELDRDGKVLRRGYLELSDYGTTATPYQSLRRRGIGRRGR